ncbi:MAG: prolyl oligopeptidase family serine peptidase, partial [Bryobacteraceae bacterium]
PVLALAAGGYQKPAKEILDVLNAPAAPTVSLNPRGSHMLLLDTVRHPSAADLSRPVLRLAGLRIDPMTSGPHVTSYITAMRLKSVAGGRELQVTLPPGMRIGTPLWSSDGLRFAFTNTSPRMVELWIGETATCAVKRLATIQVNAAYGPPMYWMPDNRTLFLKLVPANRGAAPAVVDAQAGPVIQESSGKAAPVRTYQDMLASPHDEDLFEHYATSQLALVDTLSGKATAVGAQGLYYSHSPSPDGRYLLVTRTRRPFSYLHAYFDFPNDVEVWDGAGKMVYKVASRPLRDRVPILGVATGRRSILWRASLPATLTWVEALDGGDPRRKALFRDEVLALAAPFASEPGRVYRGEQRVTSVRSVEKSSLIIVTDYDPNRRWTRSFLVDTTHPDRPARSVWDRSSNDRYKDPGEPLVHDMGGGHHAIRYFQHSIFLAGDGATPDGDRPFLDRLNLDTLHSERLFQSGPGHYETVLGLAAGDGSGVFTRRESATEPPNVFLRVGGALTALTAYKDPSPQLQAIHKELVTYKRADGVALSFTLYLPPGYRKGTRLPTVIWAYPREFTDQSTAGQVSGSAQRFTRMQGASHLFFLLAGYAVLDNAAMPVVGDPETVNNTYLEQIVASAKAAIDKAAEMGVTDPARVGVGGHSYGAFMTANLLAHSDLFKAGVARSGAYNRTLTPFGFQGERRTLWEASDTYLRMSPFLHANKIKEPLLLIHGEADNNPGTFPIQSERMYQAVRGNGGTVRLVMLPHESHGYAARESIEHTLYEMVAWFDRYVKHADMKTH